MSKAVLVIDIPESCDKCPLLLRHDEERCCIPAKRNSFTDKPDWCPLKPMPRIKFTYVDHDCGATIYYNQGWNGCINAILGDE